MIDIDALRREASYGPNGNEAIPVTRRWLQAVLDELEGARMTRLPAVLHNVPKKGLQHG